MVEPYRRRTQESTKKAVEVGAALAPTTYASRVLLTSPHASSMTLMTPIPARAAHDPMDALFIPSRSGDLPLHFCAFYDFTQAAETLITFMHKTKKQYFTPFHNHRKLTPWQLAESRGFQKLSKFLKDSEKSLIMPVNQRSKPHVQARGIVNAHRLYPKRLEVPDHMTPWDVPWVLYNPTAFTHRTVLLNDRKINPKGWADPEDVHDIKQAEWDAKVSHEGKLIFDQGTPRNPRGRTGMSERGLLGKWGPNLAADPIITRSDPTGSGVLQVIAALRADHLGWGLPGGMVVHISDNVPPVIQKGFETLAKALRDAELKEFTDEQAALFESGEVVYRGYVDDPRNTDNAWMETQATHFHCNQKFGARLSFPTRTTDPGVLTWINIDVADERYEKLFGNHAEWVESSVLHLRDDNFSRQLKSNSEAEAALVHARREEQREQKNNSWLNAW
uniref:Nudix hydrolase domain-containing protein n=1 Tax=Haptolina brevifila TaxID=156173 RepID=A0A7S2JNZ6_9EUKA|mmetsp:Transcript_85989/g.171732  ORF Transcript_85989/g.171732 Transcript_85989/m.171732 type:complete len:447 (+) Transcript_85989:483-1823(+)